VKALGLAIQLAQRRHLRRELERKAPLDEALLPLLVRAQQPLAHLAHRVQLLAPIDAALYTAPSRVQRRRETASRAPRNALP